MTLTGYFLEFFLIAVYWIFALTSFQQLEEETCTIPLPFLVV